MLMNRRNSYRTVLLLFQFLVLASALVAAAVADKPHAHPEPAPYAAPPAYAPPPSYAYKPAYKAPAYKEPEPVPANYAFSYGVEDQ